MHELPGKPEESGFLMKGERLPWSGTPGIRDPILVKAATGMDWGEYTLAWGQSQGNENPDIRVMIGVAAMAVWENHRDWSIEQVVKYLDQINMAEIDVFGTEEDDARPPELTPSVTSTSGDPSESMPVRSDTSLDSTGLRPSEITAV
jgi:hypothetical protein